MDTLPLVKKQAIQVARELYNKWAAAGTSFEGELSEYLENGMVFARPDLFMMAKIVDMGDGHLTWYIRMAVGSLSELLRSLPIYAPKVCFTRHGDPRLRTYSLRRIAQFVASQQQKEKRHGQ